MPSELDEYCAHVAHRIRTCEVRTAPYAHAIIDDVFPEPLYRRMLDELPESRRFRRAQFGRRRLEVMERGTEFWKTLHGGLLSPVVKQEIVDRFSGHLRPGLDTARLVLRECTLVRDGFGYEIPPHADAPHKKVVTLIFYLARSGDRRGLGTCLLTPRPGFRTSPLYQWYAWRDFRIAGRVNFRPNRLFAFPVTEQSFHAVPRILRFTRRDSLQAFIA